MKLVASLLLAGSTTVAAFAPISSVRSTPTALNVAVGDSLPSVELLQGFPDVEKINMAEYSKDKNMIIVGLPGAFTPTCSAVQVPGYKEAQADLQAAGVDKVLVYCVNDPAVMQAWSMDQGVSNSDFITMMGDPSGAFTDALGDLKMTSDGPPSVGIIGRSKRFALHVVNGEIKYVAVSEAEDDPAGDADPSASCAPALLEAVQKKVEA